MAASGATWPKPLVPVLGVSLLERNLWALARHGIDRAVVLMPADSDELESFLVGPGRVLAAAAGIELKPVVESKPLGSVGGLRLVCDAAQDFLVLNADNLTSVDLGALVAYHRERGADLTLACHEQEWQYPFGVLELAPQEPAEVIAYHEKPRQRFLTASAVSVFSRRSIHHIRGDESLDLPALASRLLNAGASVAASLHQEAWIDVNDLGAAAAAERMVAARPDSFERWAPMPDAEQAVLMFQDAGRLALYARSGSFVLPAAPVSAESGPERAARDLAQNLIGAAARPELLAAIDEAGPGPGPPLLVRRHLFVQESLAAFFSPGKEPRVWLGEKDLRALLHEGGAPSWILRAAAIWLHRHA